MNGFILHLFISVNLFIGISVKHINEHIELVHHETEEPVYKKPGTTELFVEIGDLHGIVIDNFGNMFVGKSGTEILKVTPDGKYSVFASISDLDDKTENTRIYNMAVGSDGNIYIAAKDRILKMTGDGKLENYIKDQFSGEWGACDLKFDKEGNLFVVHGKMVNRYDKNLNMNLFIDGEKYIKAAVGIEFDCSFSHLFLSDVFGKAVLKYTLNSTDSVGKPEIYNPLRFPEHMAADDIGNVYVTLAGGNAILKIGSDGILENLLCEGKLIEPWTIAMGRKGFDQESAYVVSKGKIFKVYLGLKSN